MLKLITINPNYHQVKYGPFVVAKIIKNAKKLWDVDMLDQKFIAPTVAIAFNKIEEKVTAI